MYNVDQNYWRLEGNDCLIDKDDPSIRLTAPDLVKHETIVDKQAGIVYQTFQGVKDNVKVAIQAPTPEAAVKQC